MFSGENHIPPNTGQADVRNKNTRYRQLHELFAHYQQDADLDAILKRGRSNYLGMLRFLDDQFRRFVVHLQDTGLYENTIFIFVLDHGDLAGEYGMLRKGLELSEFLVRVPMIFAGYGASPKPAIDDLHVSLVDILPTLCEACSLELPKGVQGRSLWPVISGHRESSVRDSVPGFESVYAEWGTGKPALPGDEFAQLKERFFRRRGYNELNPFSLSGSMRMVRKGRWKLVYALEGESELYNLDSDPYELTNCYNDPNCSTAWLELVLELAMWTTWVQQNEAIKSRSILIRLVGNTYPAR
jgi:arylsulfatase A-like enzyme